jgi:phage gpG-like protein
VGARVEGAREASELLGGIAARLREPTPALRAEAERMLADARASISSRTAPAGSDWPALKQTTERDGRRGRPRAPTRRSGRLAASGRVLAEQAQAIVEFTAPYAGFVQDGTDDMDARRFLPFVGDSARDEGSMRGLEQRVGEWIVRGAR